MFRRVAENIAAIDDEYSDGFSSAQSAQEFYEAMTRLEFLPNSPTLMNAGRKLQQLSACFVLPVEDSIDAMFDTLKHAARVHQSGGGTGFAFSRVRPNGDLVSTSGGRASGPLSFMRIFNEATEVISQGGFRRGANMAVLRVDHPDVVEFIRTKNEEGTLRNFNVSVGITHAFMDAVRNDASFSLVNPRNGKSTGSVRARELFDRIVESAWHNGEPGVLFLDRINEGNPTPKLGEIESTNPCGEQPLLPYESCNLGSLNLAKVYRDGEIDFDKLRELARLGVHFLDNVIDANRYPLPQIEAMTRGNRKIGLGVMGFADLLIRLGIPYDSGETRDLGARIMAFIQREADEMSRELAETRGPFPNFANSIFAERSGAPLRNATRTTIAPTGTLSIIANCSGGIEPVFALAFVRHILDGQELREVHPLFAEVFKREGLWSDELLQTVEQTGTLSCARDVPEELRRLFVTAREISPETHVRIQSAFQRHVDNAVSKTINFPQSATLDDVRAAFMLAHELGCKGITVYRDRSRISQVLSAECACARDA